jgi:hypothetical protein
VGLLSKPNANELAVGDVHRDFKTETHFGVLGLGPHNYSPKVKIVESTGCNPSLAIHRYPSAAQPRSARNADESLVFSTMTPTIAL